MRTLNGLSVVACAIVFITTSSPPRAEVLPGPGPRALGPALLKTLERDRCAFLAVALGPSRDGTVACKKFRSKSGEVLVQMVAMDGEKTIELFKCVRRAIVIT